MRPASSAVVLLDLQVTDREAAAEWWRERAPRMSEYAVSRRRELERRPRASLTHDVGQLAHARAVGLYVALSPRLFGAGGVPQRTAHGCTALRRDAAVRARATTLIRNRYERSPVAAPLLGANCEPVPINAHTGHECLALER